MSRLLTLVSVLLISSTAFAEQLLYVCERPVWDGTEGCGPNNTHSTYSFQVETRDYRDENPEYILRAGKGCEVSNKQPHSYVYHVEPEALKFEFANLPNAPRNKLWRSITIDLNTMKGHLSDVDHGSELVCRLER